MSDHEQKGGGRRWDDRKSYENRQQQRRGGGRREDKKKFSGQRGGQWSSWGDGNKHNLNQRNDTFAGVMKKNGLKDYGIETTPMYSNYLALKHEQEKPGDKKRQNPIYWETLGLINSIHHYPFYSIPANSAFKKDANGEIVRKAKKELKMGVQAATGDESKDDNEPADEDGRDSDISNIVQTAAQASLNDQYSNSVAEQLNRERTYKLINAVEESLRAEVECMAAELRIQKALISYFVEEHIKPKSDENRETPLIFGMPLFKKCTEEEREAVRKTYSRFSLQVQARARARMQKEREEHKKNKEAKSDTYENDGTNNGSQTGILNGTSNGTIGGNGTNTNEEDDTRNELTDSQQDREVTSTTYKSDENTIVEKDDEREQETERQKDVETEKAHEYESYEECKQDADSDERQEGRRDAESLESGKLTAIERELDEVPTGIERGTGAENGDEQEQDEDAEEQEQEKDAAIVEKIERVEEEADERAAVRKTGTPLVVDVGKVKQWMERGAREGEMDEEEKYHLEMSRNVDRLVTSDAETIDASQDIPLSVRFATPPPLLLHQQAHYPEPPPRITTSDIQIQPIEFELPEISELHRHPYSASTVRIEDLERESDLEDDSHGHGE